MKKRVIAATMLSLGLLLTGCGAQGGTTEKSSEADSNKPVKIVAVGSTALQPLVDLCERSIYTRTSQLYSFCPRWRQRNRTFASCRWRSDHWKFRCVCRRERWRGCL